MSEQDYLSDLEEAGVKAAAKITRCDAKAMLKQLQDYHLSQGLRGDMRFRATQSVLDPAEFLEPLRGVPSETEMPRVSVRPSRCPSLSWPQWPPGIRRHASL